MVDNSTVTLYEPVSFPYLNGQTDSLSYTLWINLHDPGSASSLPEFEYNYYYHHP
jgi:hypothetical protein